MIRNIQFSKEFFASFVFPWMPSLSVHKFVQSMKCQSNSTSNPLAMSAHGADK